MVALFYYISVIKNIKHINRREPLFTTLLYRYTYIDKYFLITFKWRFKLRDMPLKTIP